MFTTCLFVIVTSITTDTTSNEQSNNTGTNNYPFLIEEFSTSSFS